MRSSLASRIAHTQVLAALSIEAVQTLPTTTKCPLCGSDGTLEVSRGRTNTSYRCRNRRCAFIGDAIQLYAVAHELPLRDACNHMAAEGLLPRDAGILSLIDDYLYQIEAQIGGWQGFWLDAQERFRRCDTYVRALLAKMCVWESQETTCSQDWLGGMLGACMGEDLLENFIRGNGSWRNSWIKRKRTYLVMPMWSDFLTVTGFTVWNEDLEWSYVSTREGSYRGEVGVGLLSNYHLHEELLVATDNPIHALQLTAAGIAHGMRFPVVYVDPKTTTWGSLVVKRNVLVNYSHSLDHYRLALHQPDCQVVQPEQLALMKGMSARAKLDELYDLSKRAHVALADRLCRLDTSNAIAAAQHLNLSSTDAARVLSALPDHKREVIKNILQSRMDNQSITINNDVISCAHEGWVSAKKGLISDAMFFVDQVIWDAKKREGVANGIVIQGDRQIPFSSPFDEVKGRTLDWLTNTLLEAGAIVPMVASGWGSRLWPIARLFRAPETVQSISRLGWNEDLKILTLPQLLVEDGTLKRNPRVNVEGLPGANLTASAPLTPEEVEELVYDDVPGACYWALFSCLLANIYAPFHKNGTFGIAVVGDGLSVMNGVLLQLVDEVGIPSISFGTTSNRRLHEIKDMETESPIPIYIGQAWEETEGFGKWLRLSQERNCLAEMNRAVATGTSIEGGWIYLTEKTQTTDLKSWDRMAGLWKALPLFLAWAQKTEIQLPQTKSDLIDQILFHIEKWLEEFGASATQVMTRARTLVKIDMLDRSTAYGVRLLNFMIESVEVGAAHIVQSKNVDDVSERVVIDREADTVFISRKLLSETMAAVGLTAPPHNTVTQALKEAQCLVGTSYAGCRGYLVSQDQYNLYWALRRTTA